MNKQAHKASHRRRNSWMPRFAEQSKKLHEIKASKKVQTGIDLANGKDETTGPLSTQH